MIIALFIPLFFAAPPALALKDCSQPGVKCGQALRKHQARVWEKQRQMARQSASPLMVDAAGEAPKASAKKQNKGRDKNPEKTVCTPAQLPLSGQGLENQTEALARFARMRERYSQRICVVACWKVRDGVLVGDIQPPEVYHHYNVNSPQCAAEAKRSACAANTPGAC